MREAQFLLVWKHRFRNSLPWLIGVAVLYIALSVSAQETPGDEANLEKEKITSRNWSFTPNVTLSGTYTDNLNLESKGLEEGDFVTEVDPEFSAILEGHRLNAKMDYRMQNLFYGDNSDLNTTFHQYEAFGNAELWRERFFIDASSTLDQRIISSEGRIFVNNRTPTENRTDQLTASIRPHWRQEIGSVAETRLHYGVGIVNFEDEKVVGVTSDSQLNDFLASVGSLTTKKDKDRHFSWLWKYSHQDIDYDGDEFDDLQFKLTSVELGYPLSSNIGLIAVGGYEDNELGAAFASTDTKGPLWEAGLRWQPNPRSQIEARFGDRFFGNSYLIRWSQRGHSISTQLGYQKDIGGYAGYALKGERIIDSPSRIPIYSQGLTAQAYIRERLDAIATFKAPKSEIRVNLFSEDRDFGPTGFGTQRWYGVIPSWEWRFAPRMTFKTELYWNRFEPLNTNRIDTLIWFTAQLERRIGLKTKVMLDFSHARRESDEPLLEYQENAVTIGLTRSF